MTVHPSVDETKNLPEITLPKKLTKNHQVENFDNNFILKASKDDKRRSDRRDRDGGRGDRDRDGGGSRDRDRDKERRRRKK